MAYDTALQVLVERSRVADVINTLFQATDEREWDRVRACFASKVTFDMTSMAGGTPRQLSAREIVAGWEWAQLFARYPGHGGTTLVRDAGNPRRFLTINSWDTEEQRSHMLAEAAADCDRLDALFGELTESEVELGTFKTVSPKSR